MTLEIDVGKLKSRQEELRAELDKVNGLISLAEFYSHPKVAAPPAPPAPPAPRPWVIPAVVPADTSWTTRTPGLRRAVTVALHTGPASEKELAKFLGWELRRVRTVVASMLKYKICFLNSTGSLQLSEEGRVQAIWFQAHPEALSYNPGRFSK